MGRLPLFFDSAWGIIRKIYRTEAELNTGTPLLDCLFSTYYVCFMTIEQTIEIPASRRIFLNLPLDLPVGKAKITVTPQTEKPAANVYEAAKSLKGLAKKMGSTLTVEQFHEMQREDLRLEEEKYNRLFPNNR